MELQDQVLRFALASTITRQVFVYKSGELNVMMMFDSGAQMPVWCRSEELLIKAYPDAVKTDYYCDISGFGREIERSEVFRIPLFELSRGDVSFRIKDLLVARLFKPFIGCDLLLSETMFSKTDTITYRRNKRELIIAFDKIERPFICTAKSRNMETMGVSVWTQ